MEIFKAIEEFRPEVLFQQFDLGLGYIGLEQAQSALHLAFGVFIAFSDIVDMLDLVRKGSKAIKYEEYHRVRISYVEFVHLYDTAMCKFTSDEKIVEEILECLLGSDQEISLESYLKLMREFFPNITSERIVKSFAEFDRDSKGIISRKQLYRIFLDIDFYLVCLKLLYAIGLLLL